MSETDLDGVRSFRAEVEKLLQLLSAREEALLGTVDALVCPVCLDRPKNMVYKCGHMVCSMCCAHLERCPVCRSGVEGPMKVYL